MLKNTVITYMASPRKLPGRSLILLGCIAAALSITSCEKVETPKLISVQGNGNLSIQGNGASFVFHSPELNEATQTFIHHLGSTVRFSVPYPTSIELAINGKPLKKVDRPLLTNNYEYAGTIENPGEKTAIWKVDIQTPFDVPYSTIYTLTIVDVSGSDRSQPLSIYYSNPVVYPPTPMTMITVKHDAPPTTTGGTGPCAGGALEQSIHLCLKNPPHDPKNITTTACSYAAAVNLFQPSFPDWRISPGPCVP